MCSVKFYRTLIKVVSGGFSVYLVIDLFTKDLSAFDSTAKMIEICIVMVYALIFIILTLTRSSAPYLEVNPYFILGSGLFLYFLGTLSVFLFSFQLKANSEEFQTVWTIHNVLNIFLNLIYTSVLWRSKKE